MPIGVSITVEGLQALSQRLGKAVAQETLQPPLERTIERIKQRLQTYPPERPGQTYQRTGNLGRGWQTSIGANGGTVSNRVNYGPWVQGPTTQARVHQGRWFTTQQIAEQEAPAIEADFQQAVDKALQQ